MKLRKYNINDLSNFECEHYRNLMSDERKQRLDRMKFEDDRKRSVCGYMLALKMLSEISGIAEESIVISYDKNGKPYSQSTNLNFSISHSGEYTVCAVSESRVGVDIEKIRPLDMRSVRKFATQSEIIYIFGRVPEKDDYMSDSEEVLKRFFEVWTKKEAYGKLLGVGLGYNMKNTQIEKADTTFFEEYVISICEQ